MRSRGAFKSRRPTMTGLIQLSRHSYAAAARKQKRALMLVNKAIRSCPCTKGVKRRYKCNCKDYQEAVEEGDTILDEVMRDCICEGDEKFENCYNMQHIKALHVRCSMNEAMGRLDAAIDDAEWILELAPRLPDGYLRLGNMARRTGDDEYAWNLYSAGLEVYKKTPVGSSSKFKELFDARKPLYRRFFKQDPLLLPPEIVTHIFSYLDFVELPVCLRVCKKWNSTLTRPPHCPLWRNMVFTDTVRHAKRVIRLDDIKRLLTWAGKGGAKKIEIAFGVKFIQAALNVLLKASTRLEHLEILQLKGLTLPLREERWNQLRNIAIESYTGYPGTHLDGPGGLPQKFIQMAASSLENLDLVGIPPRWFRGQPSIPSLPNLKTLRMGDHADDDVDAYFRHLEHIELNIIQVPLPILPLSVAFPRLEQLCIGPEVPYLKLDISTSGQDKWEGIWPHLKVFIFGPHSGTGSDFSEEESRLTLRHLTRLNSLQHICLEEPARRNSPCMFSSSDDPLHGLDVNQRSEFENLRSFSSRELCISADGARNLLSNAVKANQLISFDIVFPDREDADDHLEGFEWLRGAPSIQTLGCYQYPFLSDLKGNDELLLPEFLATFPNLRTLSIGNYSSIEAAQLARVLLAILRVTHLKTIYLTVYPCDKAFLSRLKRIGKDSGVKIIHNETYDHGQSHLYGARPLKWPMPMSALGG